jgi:hypothetical protein
MKRWMPACLPLAAALLVGCGSGGGGVLPGLCIGFQGTAAAASTAVAAQGPGTQCDLVEVAVRLTGVNDVYTVSFQADFDPLVTKYEGYSIAGSQLASGGATVNVLENVGAGSVSLGVSRVNPATGINFTTTGTVITLKFSAVSDANPATGPLSFSNTQVLGSEAPPQEKAGITWFGGTLVIG